MKALLAEFEPHQRHVADRARVRRDAVALRSVVDDREGREAVTVQESLGKWQPGDELQGDVNFRTLRSLLKLVDEAGFERSPHQVAAPQFSGPVLPSGPRDIAPRPQLKFHAAFERAAARVIYRDSWGTQRPAIMKKHNWKTTPGEVLISTPRRFGKTFSLSDATILTHEPPTHLRAPFEDPCG